MKMYSGLCYATLRASSSGTGESGDSQSRHTYNALPMSVLNGNRVFVRITLLLEKRQHALQETYSRVGNWERRSRVGSG